ncbi:unnamed protein product [Prorocentrum cordatum]|nr:unnamed protein product [Polarella glacialis]
MRRPQRQEEGKEGALARRGRGGARGAAKPGGAFNTTPHRGQQKSADVRQARAATTPALAPEAAAFVQPRPSDRFLNAKPCHIDQFWVAGGVPRRAPAAGSQRREWRVRARGVWFLCEAAHASQVPELFSVVSAGPHRLMLALIWVMVGHVHTYLLQVSGVKHVCDCDRPDSVTQ